LGREEEVTFLKKSNQKTFAPGGDGRGVPMKSAGRRTSSALPCHRPQEQSLFAAFSSEKEVLTCLP
jgi:hypothetical protein